MFKNCARAHFEACRPRDLTMEAWSMYAKDVPAGQVFYHGTKADLAEGDLIGPGYASNYGKRKAAKFVYFAATLEAAVWGAELAQGDGRGRIYVVAPTGAFEDDPNLTDTKFPGNITQSYRSRAALRVVGEVAHWTGHSPEQLKTMRDHVAALERLGVEAIED
jgi:rifampin ADP-ribosylating transferase